MSFTKTSEDIKYLQVNLMKEMQHLYKVLLKLKT
jgi:hypothetical protein